MATAKLTPVVPVDPNVLLELTPDEAKTLVVLLNLVGGSPTESARKHTDAIRRALNNIGYAAKSYDRKVNRVTEKSSVFFLTPDGKGF